MIPLCFSAVAMLTCALPSGLSIADSPTSESTPVARFIVRHGKLVDCRAKSTVGLKDVQRQFTQFKYDECAWDATGERDRANAFQLRSIWGDPRCSAEEGFTNGSSPLGDNDYKDYLASRGFSEIRLASSNTVTINGRNVLAQILSARMPESFQPDRPRYQVAVWLWNLPGHSFNISCYGPDGVFPSKLPMVLPIVNSIVVSAP